MKTIVIFCKGVDASGYPFNERYYVDAYQDLLLALKQRNVQAYFASDNATYLGDGVFSVAYTTDVKLAAPSFTRAENVRADLVYEKGGFLGDDVAVLNPPAIRKLSNKIETYQRFKQLQPQTIVCNSMQEVLAAFAALPGDRVVAKAPEGYGGKLVFIGSRAEVLQKMPNQFPLLVQEFLDTSVGVPGLVDGLHDVRVEMAGGKILGGILRVPAPGELRANVALGGSERVLSPEELPQEAVEIARTIDNNLAQYARHYACDFARTPNGWKLIEINSKPGLTPVASSPQARQLMGSLADYIVSNCP